MIHRSHVLAIAGAIVFTLLTIPADLAARGLYVGIFFSRSDDLWLLPLVAYTALTAAVLFWPARRGVTPVALAAAVAALVYSPRSSASRSRRQCRG